MELRFSTRPGKLSSVTVLRISTRPGKKLSSVTVASCPAVNSTDFYVGQKVIFPDIGGIKLTGIITEIEYRSFDKIFITLEGESGGIITLDLQIEFPLVEVLDDF